MEGGHFIPFDVAALGVIALSFAGALPSIASGVACIYYALLIYDRLRRK